MVHQRRPPPPPTHISAVPTRGPVTWEVLQPLFTHLEKFLLQAGLDAFSGLPAPHQETHLVGGADELAEPGDPTTVDAGSTADPGLGPSFAREDHEHAVTTGAAISLGEANAEGSGVALARAGHVHRLDVRVAKDGITIGTRKRINFVSGSGGALTVADDSTNDEIDVTIGGAGAVSGSSVESLNDWYTRKAVEAYGLRGYNAATYR